MTEGEGKQSGEMGHVHDFCAETRERERIGAQCTHTIRKIKLEFSLLFFTIRN